MLRAFFCLNSSLGLCSQVAHTRLGRVDWSSLIVNQDMAADLLAASRSAREMWAVLLLASLQKTLVAEV